jgi:hypothetical protein
VGTFHYLNDLTKSSLRSKIWFFKSGFKMIVFLLGHSEVHWKSEFGLYWTEGMLSACGDAFDFIPKFVSFQITVESWVHKMKMFGVSLI